MDSEVTLFGDHPPFIQRRAQRRRLTKHLLDRDSKCCLIGSHQHAKRADDQCLFYCREYRLDRRGLQ
jgi:hypothetical protein